MTEGACLDCSLSADTAVDLQDLVTASAEHRGAGMD